MCKDDPNEINNFNLSVGITEGFMEAVQKDADWALINPAHGNVVKTVKARYLWDMIIHQAWKNGEPGVAFLDTINAKNPTPEYGRIEATNPCGEQPLLPYESCNLGSINLANFVRADGQIKLADLKNTVRVATNLLNSVLDHNHFPLPQIEENTLRTRKIGLGVMGWADMLLKLRIRYDSPMARELATKLMKDIKKYLTRKVAKGGIKTPHVLPLPPLVRSPSSRAPVVALNPTLPGCIPEMLWTRLSMLFTLWSKRN